ncbi:MAG: hypothetical protein ACREE0_07415 [Phenylobacterium sp.]
MEGYSRAEWFAFRADMIKLHDGQCTTCGRAEPEVVLQVHHRHYVPGRLPWQYGFDECDVLCRGCHGREHGKLRPNHGWRCLGYSDLEDLIGTCEVCGTGLRYVFLIDHPNWPALEVGEDCCDHFTDSVEASTHMESRRRYVSRLKTFVSSPRWKPGKGVHEIRQRKIDLAVRQDSEGFRLWMDGHRGKRIFASMLDAKATAFQLIESGEAAVFLRKKADAARQQRRREAFRPAR